MSIYWAGLLASLAPLFLAGWLLARWIWGWTL